MIHTKPVIIISAWMMGVGHISSVFIVISVVLVQLGNPCSVTIVDKSRNTFQENVSATLKCKASNCNDGQTSIVWDVNGNSLTGNSVSELDGNNDTISTLTQTFTRTHNKQVLRCKTGAATDSIELDITYKPTAVNLQPSTTSYSIPEGNNLNSITCSADCNPPCSYKWNRLGSTNVLQINNLQKSHTGAYTCTASNSIGDENSPSVTVNVLYKPTSVILQPSTTSYSIPEGNNLNSITCSADCNPPCSYTWNKISNSRVLQINNLQKSHRGTYTCTASNSVGSHNSPTVTLNIQYKPTLVVLQPSTSSYPIAEGSNLNSITCSADCNPPCSFRWNKYSNTEVLQINNLQKSHTGTYTCTASNSIGNKESPAISVNVLYKPKAVLLLPSTSQYTKSIGDNINAVTCSADCNPKCTYTWSRTGTSSLVLNNIKKTDSGDYVCTARNSQGTSDSPKINVNVRYPPTTVVLSPPKTNYEVTKGRNFGPVSCSADCNPSCTFRWSSTHQNELRFNNIGEERSGQYSCTASNSEGNAISPTITIDVQYAAAFVSLTPPQTSYTVSENIDSIGPITCQANCNPPCQFWWSKTNTPSLKFESVKRGNDGQYQCRAKNKIGNTYSSEVTIKVQYPPYIYSATKTTYEGNTVLLPCSANGVPADYIYKGWKHQYGDMVIRDSATLEQQGLRELNLSKVSYMDIGDYYCSVTNGIPDVNGTKIQTGLARRLQVKVAPFGFKTSYTETGTLGKPLRFALPFISFGDFLRAEWFRKSTGKLIKFSANYNYSIEPIKQKIKVYSTTIEQDGYQAVINIKSLVDEDFGEYFILISNNVGKKSFHLHISKGESSDGISGPLVAGAVLIVLAIVFVVSVIGIFVFLYRRGKIIVPFLAKSRSKDADGNANPENVNPENNDTYEGLNLEEVDQNQGIYTAIKKENPYSNTNLAPKAEEELYVNQRKKKKSHFYENHAFENDKNPVKNQKKIAKVPKNNETDVQNLSASPKKVALKPKPNIVNT